MKNIPENYNTNEKYYIRFYYVRIIKKLLKKYDLITSLKIISKRLGKSGIKNFFRNSFIYFTDEKFTDEIYKEIIKDYNYKPKEIKIKLKKRESSFKNPEIQYRAKLVRLEKYGDPYYNNHEKCKETKLKRYGDPYYNNKENSKKADFSFRQNHFNDKDNLYNKEFWLKNFIKNKTINKQKVLKYFNISQKIYFKIKNEIFSDFNTYSYYNLESKWLNEIENLYFIKIIRQKIIFNKRVDGFIKEISESLKFLLTENLKYSLNEKFNGIIFEFLGDYWHGFKNNLEINEVNNKTFKELHDETFKRFNDLKNLGYLILYQWESDYNKNGLKFKIYSST